MFWIESSTKFLRNWNSLEVNLSTFTSSRSNELKGKEVK